MPDVKANGLKIHFVEEGSGDAVVFVHGLVMDHTMYAAQFEDLPDSYRCIALDLRGHGRSECPPGPWSMQDSVDDVVEFIRAVGSAPCHLIGMSWGGMIASRLALQYPDLVRSLVLIDTTVDKESEDWAAVLRGYLEAVDADGLTDDIIESSLSLLYGETFRTNQKDAIDAHFDRVRSMRPAAVVEGLRAIVERDSLLDRGGEIGVPVLVIHGEEDLASSIAEAEKTVAAIKGARLVRLPGIGHTSPLEAPDEVNAALAEFLRSGR